MTLHEVRQYYGKLYFLLAATRFNVNSIVELNEEIG